VKGCVNLQEQDIREACPKLAVFNNKQVQWREQYFDNIRQIKVSEGKSIKPIKKPKLQKMLPQKKKRSKEDGKGEDKAAKELPKSKRVKVAEEQDVPESSNLETEGKIKLKTDAKTSINVEAAKSKNISGIKRVIKTREKETFKSKTKEEKLKLLSKLYPF